MDLLTTALVTTGLLAFGIVSGRLEGTVITAPMVFIAFGLAIGPGGFGIADLDPGHGSIHLIAEFTLILVLFTDAARIDLDRVKRDHNLPVRMLVIGLPLIILLGAWFATLLFPQLTLWEAALLGALLAPTDAALGQSVVSAKSVPIRIRQAINVESGLNDGVALPAVLLLAALASADAGSNGTGDWIRFAVLQVTLGPLVGIAIGYVGARLLDTAAQKEWSGPAYQGIGILALAVFAYVVAELVGGNGFIAAFVAGAVFGNTIKNACTFLFEFMETEGQLLMLITFLIFGATLLPEALAHADVRTVVYAVLSLTIIRIIPIVLALVGSGVSLPTKLFLGWFGPRGLASILFVLLILEKSNVPHREELLAVTVITVALSALLHGITAAPLANAYGRMAAEMGDCEENIPTTSLPLRSGNPDSEGTSES